MDVLRRRRWKFVEWSSLLTVVVIEILKRKKKCGSGVILHSRPCKLFHRNSKTYFSLRSNYMRIGVLVVIASAFAVGTLQRYGVSKDTQELSTLDMLVIRLVNNGDALIYSYPNGFIERLDGRNPVRALLKDYLSTFRIVSPDDSLSISAPRSWIYKEAMERIL